MIKCWKLTDENCRTHGGRAWVVGEWAEAKPGRLEPCSDTALHGYTHPLLAVLLNPLHGNFAKTRLWEAEFEGKVRCDGLKVWGRKQRILRELPLPVFTKHQWVVFAILATRLVLKPGALPIWDTWADNYLAGKRQPAEASRAARASRAAAWAARAASEDAAWAAVRAASEAAAWAAGAAAEDAKNTYWAAAWAARAAWAAGIDALAFAAKLANCAREARIPDRRRLK